MPLLQSGLPLSGIREIFSSESGSTSLAAVESGPAMKAALRPLATIDRYAETSPEMTMFGQLLLDALPQW